jgi:hypothetical protein
VSDYAFSLKPILVAFGGVFGAGLTTGLLIGQVMASPTTLSTMEAVIDRAGMRWSRDDTRRYCTSAGYMKPTFESTFVDGEVLPARDGADVGTLVCYWRIAR